MYINKLIDKMIRTALLSRNRFFRVATNARAFHPLSLELNQGSIIFNPRVTESSHLLSNTEQQTNAFKLAINTALGGVLQRGIFTTLVDSCAEAILFLKRTFQPSLIRRKRKHGFLARVGTRNGRKVLANRLAKGRRGLCA